MMKKLLAILLFLLLPVSFVCSQVVVVNESDSVMSDEAVPLSALPWPENVQEVLDSLLFSPLFETSQVSVLVYDLTADSVLYYRCPRQRMRPASTLKLLTSVTALDRLGYDYVLRTSVYHDGSVDSLRSLCGSVYVRGGMDPCLGEDDLRGMIDAVCALGIDTIRGDVCGDVTMKDGKLLGEGWCWDDDNPSLSPLLLNGRNVLLSRFADGLRARGIVVCGDGGALRETPSGATLLTTRYHSVGDLLPRVLKQSNNLYAEVLFYHIGASLTPYRCTAGDAIGVERGLLERLGIGTSHYRLADGSGLSLYNYLTAEAEVALLRYAYGQPHIFRYLYDALPIAGVDGTLKGRMRKSAAAGNVRAKTGTLEGVSTLAGYCQAANGHWLCFSIMNNGLERKSDGQHFQNRVCMALCQRYE